MELINRIEGARELVAKFRTLSASVQGATLRKAGRIVGDVVAAAAARNLSAYSSDVNRLHKTYRGRRVAGGFSARSVRSEVRLSRDKSALFVAIGVLKEAFYAVNFVELGVQSRGIPARPWLRPAMESTRAEQIDIVQGELRAAIARASRRNARAAARYEKRFSRSIFGKGRK